MSFDLVVYKSSTSVSKTDRERWFSGIPLVYVIKPWSVKPKNSVKTLFQFCCYPITLYSTLLFLFLIGGLATSLIFQKSKPNFIILGRFLSPLSLVRFTGVLDLYPGPFWQELKGHYILIILLLYLVIQMLWTGVNFLYAYIEWTLGWHFKVLGTVLLIVFAGLSACYIYTYFLQADILLAHLWLKEAVSLPIWTDVIRQADVEFRREDWEAQPWYKKTILNSYPDIIVGRLQRGVIHFCIGVCVLILVRATGGRW